MTEILTPSTGAVRGGSHINFNIERFAPKQRVLYRNRAGEHAVAEIDAFTDMSGNYFTIGGEVIFVKAIELRVPDEVEAGALLAELSEVPKMGVGHDAYQIYKANIAAVLRRHGIEA